MKATQQLHDLGQSLWLDNITRDLLNSGTLKLYIDDLSVTGLTSNPTIFDHAIKNSTSYDSAILWENRRMMNSAGRTTAMPISMIMRPSKISRAVIVFPSPTAT